MLQDQFAPNWTLTPTSGLQINTTAISANGAQLITGTSSEYGESSDFAIYSYATDGSAPSLQWSDPLGDNVTQGVFWVAVSGNGGYAAAGGQYGSGNGFLRTYNIGVGVSSRQEFSVDSRINEVESSYDGSTIIAVEGANALLLTLNGQSYTDSQTNVSESYLRSCGVCNTGEIVVVGGELDSYSESVEFARGRKPAKRAEVSSTGLVILYANQSGTLVEYGRFHTATGVLRVVISADGGYFAASTKNGYVYLFAKPDSPVSGLTPLWSYTPSDQSLGLTYALAIANVSGQVYVGAGGNYDGSGATKAASDSPGFGFAYMLKNAGDSGDYYPQRLWINQLEYCPNPGMNMDANAQYVTSADGEPIFSDSNSSPQEETPGNFYLFNAQTGELYWKYATSLMNWPMSINAEGTAVFAGSDDGSVYYWGSPAL
ncbi:hypothetical protein ENC22_20800 [Hahella sp. KA22]|uniref:hypothetical protein n=1 Tax=Hahella sp. KA22 TaxID=1628392 RepID=UPI000FDEC67D|nr:hypothetical protein [Hahella sp. KA22]AZZ93504.1 hypothetical protein ENC22_20800 [Hahella sp. KA22]